MEMIKKRKITPLGENIYLVIEYISTRIIFWWCKND